MLHHLTQILSKRSRIELQADSTQTLTSAPPCMAVKHRCRSKPNSCFWSCFEKPVHRFLSFCFPFAWYSFCKRAEERVLKETRIKASCTLRRNEYLRGGDGRIGTTAAVEHHHSPSLAHGARDRCCTYVSSLPPVKPGCPPHSPHYQSREDDNSALAASPSSIQPLI